MPFNNSMLCCAKASMTSHHSQSRLCAAKKGAVVVCKQHSLRPHAFVSSSGSHLQPYGMHTSL